MTLTIETFPAGPVATNGYLVIDNETDQALIIDAPIDSADAILSAAAARGASIAMIVITHPHWDHIGDAAELHRRTGAILAAHPLAEERMTKPGSSMMKLPVEIAPSRADKTLDEGDEVELGAHRFLVLHLPGHEPSHIVLYSAADKVILGGDVLFPNGHGRIDIPGADAATMYRSLGRLAALPADVTVYPGHGDPTTIGAEAWLRGYLG